MKREIKFRAWGKYGNNPHKMHYDDDITPFGDSENAMPGEVIRILQENYGWIFMQYTGLKDRNNVEIYEGDIVKWSSTHQGASKNVHIDMVAWSSEHAIYLLIPFIHELWAAEIEVIGNVYENPELGNLGND